MIIDDDCDDYGDIYNDNEDDEDDTFIHTDDDDDKGHDDTLWQ